MESSTIKSTGISLIKSGKKLGPFQITDVRAHLKTGLLEPDDLGWTDDPSTPMPLAYLLKMAEPFATNSPDELSTEPVKVILPPRRSNAANNGATSNIPQEGNVSTQRDGSITDVFKPGSFGGTVQTHIKLGKVKSEQLYIDINTTASTVVSASASGGGSSGPTRLYSSAETTLTLSAQSTYKYWILWADGREELLALPMECGQGQTLLFCSITRTVLDSDVMNRFKDSNGQFEPIFAYTDVDKTAMVIHIENLSTNVIWNDVDTWFKHHLENVSSSIFSNGIVSLMITASVICMILGAIVGKYTSSYLIGGIVAIGLFVPCYFSNHKFVAKASWIRKLISDAAAEVSSGVLNAVASAKKVYVLSTA